MAATASTKPRRAALSNQNGKGLIGFIIAIIVVGYAATSLLSVYKVNSRANEMTDFVVETLKQAEVRQIELEQVKFDLLKKAKELGIPGDHKALEVTRDSKRWRVHFEWDDTYQIPGFSHEKHFVIDKTWNRFR